MKNVMPLTSITAAETCKRCLYTLSHPLGITLDDEGICSGCRIHEEKDRLDWESRWNKLKELVAPYRVTSGRTYDCIVPVNGANDSYYILHLVKDHLGLNPLLVNYNKYFNTPIGIKNIANLRIQFDCDILFQNINPVSVKKITQSTLRAFGSIYWPCLAGQTVFPVQTAVRYKIPLIIWGAHQGLEQVGMFSHEHEVEMTRRYRKDHDLMTYEADDLMSIFDMLNEDDIWQYRYPDDAILNSVEVRGIYLGNYVRWDPKAQHEKMIQRYGYKSARFIRTFDSYDHVDCFNFMGLHDHLKMIKHGYSKVTDHACREIRHGRLSRSEAITLVKHYENQPAQYLTQFCDWLGVEPAALRFILDQHRNPAIWTRQDHKTWKRHFSLVAEDTEYQPRTVIENRLGFIINHKLCPDKTGDYVTVGKGWP